jgi:hypothetical protein
MVTAKIWEYICRLVEWFLNLLPDWQRPGWWNDVMLWLDGLSAIRHFGEFIPLGAIAVSAAALFGATVAVTIISTSRVAYSMVTGGGGAK